MSDDSYAIDDDDVVLRLPASLFVKVNCDEPAHIISSKPIRKALQEALPPQKVTQEYGIISPSITVLNNNPKNIYLIKNGKYVVDDILGSKRLSHFEIVKIISINLDIDTFVVTPIEDISKKYSVLKSNVTPFTSMTGQIYTIKTTGNKVTVKALDVNIKGNVIVEQQGQPKYISVNPNQLKSIPGANAVTEMSNFHSATINERITDINQLKSMCEDIPEDIRNNPTILNPEYENSILFGISKYSKIGSSDCFIEYMIEDDETIYIEKFMCSGEAKGTGNDLFCAFLFYIIFNYHNIKYIRLIAQPRYVSTYPPSTMLKKILQKLLNNYYRNVFFLKIDTDNEFMGCMSEFIKPCLRRITSVSLKDEQRYLNDKVNDLGGSKRRKSKKQTKRRKTQKRRKSIRKKK
jgi:hypothetical protein